MVRTHRSHASWVLWVFKWERGGQPVVPPLNQYQDSLWARIQSHQTAAECCPPHLEGGTSHRPELQCSL